MGDRIVVLRGIRVILDAEQARLYGTTTRRLNEQVRRNPGRFPEDFLLRLTAEEKREVIANCDHLHNLRYSKGLPLAFTEHGAIMAAGVLNTPRAIRMSVFVVRAFVRLRRFVEAHEELAARVAEPEMDRGRPRRVPPIPPQGHPPPAGTAVAAEVPRTDRFPGFLNSAATTSRYR